MTQPDTAPGPSSAYWTPERCAQEARFWEGANQDERAADFDWSFDQALPLSTMTGDGLRTPADWVAWMKGEIADFAADGYPHKYDEVLEEEIQEPIVIHLDENAEGRIWDGFHRTGGSHMAERQTIPAIVGRRKAR